MERHQCFKRKKMPSGYKSMQSQILCNGLSCGRYSLNVYDRILRWIPPIIYARHAINLLGLDNLTTWPLGISPDSPTSLKNSHIRFKWTN